MDNTIVVFYSKKNSNRYLADYIAGQLESNKKEIVPILNNQILLMMGVGLGIKKIPDIKSYKRVVLVGPVWMGKLIYPLKVFLKKYNNEINNLIFVTCCGSGFEVKDEKFGHGLVFNEIRELRQNKKLSCHAFPITLVLTKEDAEDPKIVMKTRLNNDTFTGEIKEKVDILIKDLKK